MPFLKFRFAQNYKGNIAMGRVWTDTFRAVDYATCWIFWHLYGTPLCNRPPESLAPSIFFNPPKKFCMPLHIWIFPVPPLLFLVAPTLGEGQKFQNTPKKQQCPLINFDPSSSFFAPDQDWIYPLIKFIPGGLLQRGVMVWSNVSYVARNPDTKSIAFVSLLG